MITISDFLAFLYEQYIYPYVESRPRDDGDTFRCSAWECGVSPDQREDGEAVIRFYAVHAFLLGLRTGAGLAEACPPGQRE